MSPVPPAPRARGCVAKRRCFSCRRSSISSRPFRAVARVCFRQPGCLYAVRKSGCLPACRQCVPSTVWSVSRVVGFWAAAGEPGKIPAASVWVPGGQSPPRPGHVASRRRVGARPSDSPSGSPTLRLRKNRAASLFLRRWKLRVVVPGARLAIRVFNSSKPASSWAVGFPGSAPIRVPDALPPGGVPSSLPSGSPPVLSLLLAAWYLAVGAPALRYVGSRRPASYPTGCRLAGSAVIRLSVSSSRSDSLRSVYRSVCPSDLDGGCGGVVGRRTVFLPAVCSSGKVGAGLRICCPAVELIGWWVLRGYRAFRQSALAVSG